MRELQVVIYARVSSDPQAEAHTIASQLAALRTRVASEGYRLAPEQEFLAEGYSGATLVRPGLERRRDLVAAGGVDRLYVHSPARLARKYAYQVLRVDELQRAGVEVVFLHRELGRTPEDELLLPVQGLVAEDERAKILERSRRGKRHAAHVGSVSVLSAAPSGYRYVSTQQGGGQARFESQVEEARVVRQIFEWVGRGRLTRGEVGRRLYRAGERTRTGKTVWDRGTVWGMLKNPASRGMAACGKTRVGPLRPRLRAQRGRQLQPRRAYAHYAGPAEEWIGVPVPALIAPALFGAVQERLRANQRSARQRQRGARYLLQGLVLCARCGYAYYGKPVSTGAAKGRWRAYAYYRCLGTDAYRFGGQRVCDNPQVRTDRLAAAVWHEVPRLLAHPHHLEQEYRRRLAPPAKHGQGDGLAILQAQVGKLRQGIARLIDSHAEGLLEKSDFEPRITRLKQRLVHLEAQGQQRADEASLQADLRLIIGRLEEFAAQVNTGLEQADWRTHRERLRTLVKRVEVDQHQVKVVFRVDTEPVVSSPGKKSLQDCGRRGVTRPRQCVPALCA
jgi:site-specific DNA recombinase